jgi:DNA-binding SARP family transcriptional activator/Tfp pilus assembly protein PilF
MRFDVLGPMRVADVNGTRPVAGVRQRIVLGALLAHANQSVPAEKLADIVWEEARPGRAVPTLRTYMTRLRQDLGPDAAARIVTRDRGYLINVAQTELDALIFETLCADTGTALRTADWAAAAEQATAALALWRGEPLGDVPSQALRGAWLPRLEQQRLQVTEWSVEAELNLGRDENQVPRLRQLIADYPLRERFHAQLMLALCHCGRRAEALAAYQDARKALIGELGIEPGRELRRLHERILADDGGDGGGGDPVAPRSSAGRVSERAAVAVPCQLPAAAGHFTGRRGELELISALPGRGPVLGADGGGGTVVIWAIDGMAGVGKTALAVLAARRMAGEFPDGQLFIDLHGYTRGCPPREPDEALGSLLRALGVPPGQVPAGSEERAGFYRQRLAGTRTLIVLDNALDEAQVRPLLPGAPGCLVLVTSRRRLKGLHDARVVALDVLPEADALMLLGEVTGPVHAAAGPGLAEIAGLCGRLPLALRIAGALLRHRPAWTPGYLAGLLRDERRRLAALTDGDHDLGAVFDLSYAVLDGRRRLLFRRLALVPGPEFDAFAGAALLDAGTAAAAGWLEDLVDHNLLVEHAPGRYRMHDLVRAHACRLAGGDPRPGRDRALDRLLGYYAHTACRAAALIARRPPPAPDGPAPARGPAVTGPETARRWLRAERESLEAAHARARARGLHGHSLALAAGLAETLRTDGPYTRALALARAAAGTAGHHGHPAARAGALSDLGAVQHLTGDLAGALGTFSRALEICRAAGDSLGEAGALAELGRVRGPAGDLPGALEAFSRALEIYRAAGDRRGEADMLSDLGITRRVTGDLSGAGDALARALEICRAAGDRHGEADALTELGRVRRLAGDLGGAGDALARALEFYQGTGHRHGEAYVLANLGAVRRLAGDLTGAGDALGPALEFYQAAGYPLGEAETLANLGIVRHLAGDLTGAGDALARAVEIYRATGYRYDQAWALSHYAAAVAAAGDPPRALSLYRQALAMYGEPYPADGRAVALEGIGQCQLASGDTASADTHLRQALDIYEHLGTAPDADRVRTQLASITTCACRE